MLIKPIYYFLITFSLVFHACKTDHNKLEIDKIPFNSSKWKIQEGRDFPFRKRMLEDLVESNVLKGKTEMELEQTLGKPSRSDKEYRFYLVDQKRLQFFPLHTTSLVIVLDSNNIVNKVLIHK